MLKGLAHPLRLQIILLLGQSPGPGLSVTVIAEQLKVEQSLASHHLIEMRQKGLVDARRQGKNVYYSLTDLRFVAIIHTVISGTDPLRGQVS
ncbi:MAG: ArsR family transcriptional regulator [Cytophagaceae bacterium]|nr:MAG: ArsR family transcriptional regulator [Cytophagaceae bacterium]